MKTFLLFPVLLFLGFSCGPSGKEATALPEQPIRPDSVEVVHTPDNKTYSDTILLRINPSDGKADTTVYKKQDQTLYFSFDSEGYHTITAAVSSQDAAANIRFNQIFLPDGTTDGPFGRQLNYELPKEGRYKISVHENIMAGDPWNGYFTLKVELK
ncbi:MAG: hypothetical protein LUG18_04590 [Candidatus Azobacteroides sp.]|nr:hypothetical protein [Candidatus Azobacteroides sp.]